MDRRCNVETVGFAASYALEGELYVMETNAEKRLCGRYAQRKKVVITLHCRTSWRERGELLDSSEFGAGLYSPERLDTGAVILLRAVASMDETGENRWPSEAGQFHMVSARVRWCREGQSPDGVPGFRIGVQRLLPFY